MGQSTRLIFLLIAVQLFGSTITAPINDKNSKVETIKYEFRQFPDNGYHFTYELSDGQIRDETAMFDKETGILIITGYYSYIGDDKKIHTVQYTADENGYDAKYETEEQESGTEPPITLSNALIAVLSG